MCLDGYDAEHDHHTNHEIEICEVGANVGKTIIEDENIKYAVEIEEKETVRPATEQYQHIVLSLSEENSLVDSQERDDRFGEHDSECHRGDKSYLLKNIDLRRCYSNSVLVDRSVSFNIVLDNLSWKCFGNEAHQRREDTSDDDTASGQ